VYSVVKGVEQVWESVSMVMGNPSLECGPYLEVAVHNVAEPVTQPKTGLNASRT
jgi:hypothetical protein